MIYFFLIIEIKWILTDLFDSMSFIWIKLPPNRLYEMVSAVQISAFIRDSDNLNSINYIGSKQFSDKTNGLIHLYKLYLIFSVSHKRVVYYNKSVILTIRFLLCDLWFIWFKLIVQRLILVSYSIHDLYLCHWFDYCYELIA